MTKLKKTNAPLLVGDISLFHDYEDDYDVFCSQLWLLTDVFGPDRKTPRKSFVFLAFRCARSGKWREHAIQWPADHLKIGQLLQRYSRWDYDMYFCPNSFSKPRRKREYALPTRFAWCDIDDSPPEDYEPHPSLLWKTSPGRFQGLWSWDKYHEPDEAEQFSKGLAYRHGGDRNGWTITKMLRLMGSVNHKPQYDEPYVQTVACDWTKIRARPLALQRDRAKLPSPLPDIDVDPNKFDRVEVIRKYRKDLHPKARTMMRNRKAYEPNRSAQIFHMIAALHEAGASQDEIASVIWPNPYFVEKHGHDLGKLNEEIARVVGKLGDGA